MSDQMQNEQIFSEGGQIRALVRKARKNHTADDAAVTKEAVEVNAVCFWIVDQPHRKTVVFVRGVDEAIASIRQLSALFGRSGFGLFGVVAIPRSIEIVEIGQLQKFGAYRKLLEKYIASLGLVGIDRTMRRVAGNCGGRHTQADRAENCK